MSKVAQCFKTVFKAILQGLELDTVFAYSTVKVVRIRDRNLGFLHFAFVLAILIYIVAIVIIKDQGYLGFDRIEGSMRFVTTKTEYTSVSELQYCSNAGTSNTNPALPCLMWDSREINYPEDMTKSVFITTRVRIQDDIRVCAEDALDCAVSPWQTVNQSDYFIAGIEEFQLAITHSVIAPNFAKTVPKSSTKFQASSIQMDGKIQYASGKTEQIPYGKPDLLHVHILLDAIGISLDDQAVVSNVDGEEPLSFRYEGLVLLIELTYDNTYEISAPANSIRYTYQPATVQHATYVAPQTVFQNATHRRVYDRYGLRMDFVQSGTIGDFQFQTLLISLVSSLGLLAVSTFIVDQVGIRFLPRRNLYHNHKFEYTEDSNQMATKQNLDTVDKELEQLEVTLHQDKKN